MKTTPTFIQLFLCLYLACSFHAGAQSFHTVTLSGSTGDFNVAERISAAANNTDYYITFDASNLYIGAFRTSGSFGSTDNFTIYLDTDPQSTPTGGTGTTAGQNYNSVTGTLPFTANYNVHVEEFYQEARSHGSSWAATISGLSYHTGSTWREVTIPLSSIGNPVALYLTVWMGYAGGIFSNAPGADLGAGSNPTVVNYVGGFGLSSENCIPVNTLNYPITDIITNAVPALNVAYGKVEVTSGTVTASNNFSIAPGGIMEVSGGTLDLSSRTVGFGGTAAGNGIGTRINTSGGATLTTNAATTFNSFGEARVLGNNLSYNGIWNINRSFEPLASAGLTIASGASMRLLSGSFFSVNTVTYASGSNLIYNTGGSYSASLEWTANSTSAAGVPHHVLIGNGVNTTLDFAASSQYRHAGGNVTISASSGLTLSTAAGGDLRLNGNFTQSGTFTHNNRAVEFSGTTAQTISGSVNTAGASNNFPYLIISNTNAAGVTLTSNTLVSQTAGNTLQLIGTGPLVVQNAITLTLAGAGGNVLVSNNAQTIQLDGASSVLSFTGSKTVTSSAGGSLAINSTVANGTVSLSAGVNFGAGGLTTIGTDTYLQIDAGGFVSTSAPVYSSGSTLVYNSGGAYNAGTEWITNAQVGTGVPYHVMVTNSTALSFAASSFYRNANGNLTINPGASLALSSAAGGNLQCKQNFINNGTFTSNSRLTVFNGSIAQSITGATSFGDMTSNNALGITLNNSITVTGVLNLTSGLITLGTNNITVTNTIAAAITGVFSNTNMIVAGSTGRLIRSIATAGLPITYVFPVGEVSGTTEYSPASFTFSANSTTRDIGVRVENSAHPQINNPVVNDNYLNRYWSTSNSAAGTYTYTAIFTCVAADITGTSGNIRCINWNGAAWSQPTATFTGTQLQFSTALTETTLPLGATSEFTGGEKGITYVWNQTGVASWATSTNWTPTRTTPLSSDILVFNNGATTTANAIPTQTIAQLRISGNTQVTLIPAAAANTLTINSGAGDDLSVASGSSLQNTTTGMNMVFAASSSSVVNIAGTLGVGVGTGSINFNNATATVSGTINNLGTITGTALTLTFSATGIYNHNHTTSGGTIPTATWSNGSLCRIQGYTTGGTPGGIGQSFHHFTWNCAAQTGNINLNGLLNTVNGNFTVSNTGTGELRLTTNVSFTLTIGGNMTISDDILVALNNGATSTINVAGNYAQTAGEFNFSDGNATNNTTLNVTGDFSVTAGTFTQTGTAASAAGTVNFVGTGAKAVTFSVGIADPISFRLNNAAGITITGTLPISDNAFFYRMLGAVTSGTISYASGGGLSYENASLISSTNLEWPTVNAPTNLQMNSTSQVNLHANRSLPAGGVFTMLSGILNIGTFDFTIFNNASAAIVNASPSATNMVQADGTGQLKRAIDTGGPTYLFPVGDQTGTAEYSGVEFNFATNNTARVLGVRVVDGRNANDSTTLLPSIDFTTRTWYTTLDVATGTYSYTPTFTYAVPGDVYGTENNMLCSRWNGATWVSRPSNVTSPTIQTNNNANQTNFSLNNGEFLGRAPVKYWNGDIDSDWANGLNWVPNGVPAAADNVVISFSNPNPCILSSGSVTVNHFTLTGEADFTMNSGASITVSGNFDYDNPLNVVFSCGSTFALTNTVYTQTIPAIQFGNLTVGTNGDRIFAASDTIKVCNDFIATNGTQTTTGSTVMFNGTTAQTILTRNADFNDLVIANTSATVTSNRTIDVVGDMVVLPSARFEQAAMTLDLNVGSTCSVDGFLRLSQGANMTTAGTLTVNNTYEHNYTTGNGSIPTATWSAGSTCLIMGYTTNTNDPGGLAQNFHHFTWNCPSQTAVVNLSGSFNTTINGDFTVISTGSSRLRFTGNTPYTLNILGNWVHTNGGLDFSNGTAVQTVNLSGNYTQAAGTVVMTMTAVGTPTFNVDGNFQLTGGSFNLASSTGNATVVLLGNLDISGAATLLKSNSGSPSSFNFRKTTGTQTYSSTAGGISPNGIAFNVGNGTTTNTLQLLTDFTLNASAGSLTVQNNAILECYTRVVGGNSFILNAGGTIRMGSPQGINNTVSGNVQTTATSFSGGGHYVYNGLNNQSTGALLPATITGSLRIANQGIVSDNIVTLTSTGTTTDELYLDLGLFACGTGQILNISNTGTIDATSGDFVTGSTAGIINFPGSGTWSGTTNPYIVRTSGAVNFGTGSVTIQNGGTFRIDAGGSVATNTCTYHPNSTLQYNTTGTYGRGLEWSATSGAGYPGHVQISNSTTLNLGNGSPAISKQCAGNLTIDNGCSLSMNTTPMSAALTVLGNVSMGSGVSGSLILSSVAGGDLNVAGNWTENTGAVFTPNNRTVTFNAPAGNQTISTVAGNAFWALNVAPSAGNLILNSDANIHSAVTFTSGKIDLNGFDCTLGTNALAATITGAGTANYFISPSATSEINRFVPNNSTSYLFPIGDAVNYTPITVTFYSGAMNPNSQLACGLVDGNHPQLGTSTNYISRYWALTDQNITQYTGYGISAVYTDADIVGLEASLFPVKYNPQGWIAPNGSGAFWMMGTGSVIPATNTLSWSGLYTFSDMSGSGNGSPLPITLLNFDASALPDGILCQWATASEVNNDYFTIEHSMDGTSFEKLAYPDGAGNSVVTINYSWLHQNPEPGMHYYRLRQTDFDGTETLSNLAAVNWNQSTTLATGNIIIYPVPVSSCMYISIPDSDANLNYAVYDQSGRVVNQGWLNGANNRIELSELATGLYILRVDGLPAKTFLKNRN